MSGIHRAVSCNMNKKSAEQKQNNQSLRRGEKCLINLINRFSSAIDYAVLAISILLLILGAYALYDSNLVLEQAGAEEYAVYKPRENGDVAYRKLRSINPDVIGWIDVYGTKIDYPILQGKDNYRYLSETVNGEYSTAGSIFLDSGNKPDFSDFNNIIYGHFMVERKMFGDIGLFAEADFFNSHEYGVIHRNDKQSLGLHFFAFIQTVGTDQRIFQTSYNSVADKESFIKYIFDKAQFKRDIGVTAADRLVVMDTCNFTITDGRYILVAKLEDQVQVNPDAEKVKPVRLSNLLAYFNDFDLFYALSALWLILVLLYLIYKVLRKLWHGKDGRNN